MWPTTHPGASVASHGIHSAVRRGLWKRERFRSSVKPQAQLLFASTTKTKINFSSKQETMGILQSKVENTKPPKLVPVLSEHPYQICDCGTAYIPMWDDETECPLCTRMRSTEAYSRYGLG